MHLFGVNNFFFPPVAWRRSFFVTLFFVLLSALLFWLDSFRVYESEIRVLVIGKSPSAATEQVVENFSELTSNLSFYERVLAGSDLIDDDFAGYSPDKRKALWNETVTAQRSEKSGVLIITARQDTGEKAKLLAEETTKTLFSVAGLYYTLHTDVDLRVVDGVIVKTVIRSPFQYGLISLGSAFILTVLFFLLLSVTPFFLSRRRSPSEPMRMSEVHSSEKTSQDFSVGSAVPFIDPRKFVPARPKTLSFESSHEEQQIRQEILAPMLSAEMPVDHGAETSSDKMLPGMDAETLPFEFEEEFPSEETKDEVSQMEPVSVEEPTIEEYKRRLNELLSGGK